MTEKKFDFSVAQSSYQAIGQNGNVPKPFLCPLDYYPAYVVTNENLRRTIGLLGDAPRDNVLAIAASGEQPLFYKLAGAKNVDTFDITIFARVIMDIKTAALASKMDYQQYLKMLGELFGACHPLQVAGMKQILPYMRPESVKILQEIDGARVFFNGLEPERHKDLMLSPEEFERLKSMNVKPFNFYWSNVADIHTKVKGQYDVAYLSNVFEWNPRLIVPTFCNLRSVLRPGGVAVVQTGVADTMLEYGKAEQATKDWAKMSVDRRTGMADIVMLQRVR